MGEEKEEEGQEEEEEKEEEEEEGEEGHLRQGRPKKGAHKGKGLVAAGKKRAAAMKAKGVGLFKKCTCSADLAAITGSKTMARTAAVKAVWAYIKKNKLNNGRNVKAVGKIFGGGSMFKLAGAI